MTYANTIGELAVAMPEAIPVLEKLGIDYCCHGEQSVQQACGSVGISADRLLQLITEAEKPSTPSRDWSAEPLPALIQHICETHHVYTRQAMQVLQKLAAKVHDVHGGNHPELETVERLVNEMTVDLIPHMLKEEQVLFPFVERLDAAVAAGKEPPMPFFGTVQNPVRMMMLEHETVGEKLLELRAVTNDYALPEEACNSYRALFAQLVELENDLHQHIHVENNVLFPRALDLEQRAQTSPMVGAIGEHHCSCR